MKKKLENNSSVEECSDYQKLPVSWEFPYFTVITYLYDFITFAARFKESGERKWLKSKQLRFK